MRRTVEMLRGAGTALWQQLSSIGRQTERTLLLGSVLLATAVSWATGFVLARYYSVDVLTSMSESPNDCWVNWGVRIGKHCFADYAIVGTLAVRSNPWDVYWLPVPGRGLLRFPIEYPAAALVPYRFFWTLGHWLGTPQIGLVIVLTILAVALLLPAIWASRGARGLERIVVFVVCGVIAVPVWATIDRGNSVGLVTPVALLFLLALSRRRWGLVAITVVLAATVKPQFAVLVIALFGARKWGMAAAAVVGVVVTNLAAYLLWPRDLPATIGQSLRNLSGSATSTTTIWDPRNVSLANSLILPVRKLAVGDSSLDEFFDSAGWAVGVVFLVLVVAAVVILGRRIDPVMAGIALMATASLSPPMTNRYYLVFALPVAALVARDPDGPPGSGIFDRFAAVGDRRRAVGIAVTVSVALSIVQIAVPYPPERLASSLGIGGTLTTVFTTSLLTPLAWLVTCVAIITSYALRPASHCVEVRAQQGQLTGDLIAVPLAGRAE
jgi:hypothetical protein